MQNPGSEQNLRIRQLEDFAGGSEWLVVERMRHPRQKLGKTELQGCRSHQRPLGMSQPGSHWRQREHHSGYEADSRTLGHEGGKKRLVKLDQEQIKPINLRCELVFLNKEKMIHCQMSNFSILSKNYSNTLQVSLVALQIGLLLVTPTSRVRVPAPS